MSSIPPSPRRYVQVVPPVPSLRWLGGRLARIIAFGFGSGLLRPGPGTWGTLTAWLLWAGFTHFWGAPAGIGLWVFLALGFVYGVWACGTVGRELGVPDHGGMVWDEFIAFWIVLALVPGTLMAQALAFVLFRLFDVVKPPPIRFFDKRLKSGFGVMWDDILAAAYTLLAMALLTWLGVHP